MRKCYLIVLITMSLFFMSCDWDWDWDDIDEKIDPIFEGTENIIEGVLGIVEDVTVATASITGTVTNVVDDVAETIHGITSVVNEVAVDTRNWWNRFTDNVSSTVDKTIELMEASTDLMLATAGIIYGPSKSAMDQAQYDVFLLQADKLEIKITQRKLGLFLLYLFTALVYFIPSFLVIILKFEKKTGIIVTNIFVAWTIIGWVAQIMWILNKKNN